MLLLSGVLISACTSMLPEQIRQPIENDISVAEVQGHPEDFIHLLVRWGGEIITVENRQGETWFEVLSRPLDSSGRPKPEAKGGGRFLTRVTGFLDPVEYGVGRSITFVGQVSGSRVKQVGKYPYNYPLVEAESLYLWPIQREWPERYPLYDPFYDPWYPYPYYWRRYPYR